MFIDCYSESGKGWAFLIFKAFLTELMKANGDLKWKSGNADHNICVLLSSRLYIS